MGSMRRFLTSRGLPLAAVAAASLLAGCSTGNDKAAPDPYLIGALPDAKLVAQAKAAGHWVKSGDHDLKFTGQVAPGSAAELASLITPKTTTLVATVTGGDLNEGLTIARTLHDHKLALDIKGLCAGPCADYWFPAATTSRTSSAGSWLGYVPDLSESPTATPAQRAAEAKLYTDSGVDSARFHSALDLELRAVPGSPTPPPVALWMPDKTDLVGLGYSNASLAGMWLPANLVSANAQAHAWSDVVAFHNTLVGLPPVPTTSPSPVPPPSAATTTTGH